MKYYAKLYISSDETVITAKIVDSTKGKGES